MAWPSRAMIGSIFEKLSTDDPDGFFSHVADDVEWTVQSQSTFAGTWHSKQQFRDTTWEVLRGVLNPKTPLTPKVRNIVGGSDQSYAVVEMTSDSRTLAGTEYKQTYVWVTRWKPLKDAPEGIIVEVRAYLDTALVDRIVAEKSQ